MTPNQLRQIASGPLGNSGWVRHWFHWNYPATPVLMAIQVLDVQPNGGYGPVQVQGLKELGFEHGDKHVYTIARTLP